MESLRKEGWKIVVAPMLMGIFFGIGHFLSYFFFSSNKFIKLENRFNTFLKDWLI